MSLLQQMEIWGPPHVGCEEIVEKLNLWIQEHPDRPVRKDVLQDYISSRWPLLWHLKVCMSIEIQGRIAILSKELCTPQENAICAICHNDLRGGLETLECSHRFHTMCIHRWLRTSSTCPMCRANIR